MGEAYDDDTFDKAVIPGGYAKDIRETVAGAVALGWRLYINGTSMTIEAPESANAPENKRRLHFSTRRNSGPITRLRKQISKYGDPVKLGLIQSMSEGVVPNDLNQLNVRGSIVTERPRNCTLVDRNEEHVQHIWYAEDDTDKVRPFACGGLKVRRAEKEPEQAPVAKKAATPVPTPATVAKRAAKPRKQIISEAPMMAHRGGGMSYASATTIERRWSDGSVDFKCVVCDFTSDKRMGIGGHYGRHVQKGEAPKTAQGKDKMHLVEDPTYTEPAYARGYTPRRARVEALMESLMALGLDKFTTPQQLAEAVAKASLQWVHEQSAQGTRLAAEHEELSDADILVRIRSLLDQGEYMEQRERLQQLQAEQADLRAQLEEAKAEANRQRERFEAFRELVNQEG